MKPPKNTCRVSIDSFSCPCIVSLSLYRFYYRTNLITLDFYFFDLFKKWQLQYVKWAAWYGNFWTTIIVIFEFETLYYISYGYWFFNRGNDGVWYNWLWNTIVCGRPKFGAFVGSLAYDFTSLQTYINRCLKIFMKIILNLLPTKSRQYESGKFWLRGNIDPHK